ISATKTGDVSRPAERRSPLDEVRGACGHGGPTPYGATTLRRQPCLQRVGAEGAMLGWVTTQPGGARVHITEPGGKAARTTLAQQESVRLRSSGENQMWTQVDALAPSTVYCYTLADETQMLTRPTGFKTAPAPGSTEPV